MFSCGISTSKLLNCDCQVLGEFLDFRVPPGLVVKRRHVNDYVHSTNIAFE
jgi:hypothetical protein